MQTVSTSAWSRAAFLPREIRHRHGDDPADTVTVTGNPVIASDLCGYVAAERQSGVVAVAELTLTSATEGNNPLQCKRRREQIYDASAKPKLDLPAAVTAYATKEGYKDSIRAQHSLSAGTGGNGSANAERRQRRKNTAR